MSPAVICPAEGIYGLATDAAASQAALGAFASAGVRVLIA
jgi:hypothetical protein